MDATRLKEIITINHQLPDTTAHKMWDVLYMEAAETAASLPAEVLAESIQCNDRAKGVCAACTAVGDTWIDTPTGAATVYYLDIHSNHHSNAATDPTIIEWRNAFPTHLHSVCDAAIEAGNNGLVDSCSLPEFTAHVLRQRVSV